MALSLNWAVIISSAVACGGWVGVLVQQSFVVSVNDGLDVRATTIRNFEGFSIKYFMVGVVGAKVFTDELYEFGTYFSFDGLAEWGVVVGTFSSSVLFVIGRCRFILEGVIIVGVV